MGHDVDRNIGLFGSLPRHAGTDFIDEPVLKFGGRFDRTSADDQSVGVEGIDHLVEEKAQGVGLYAEDLAAHRVARFSKAADAFCSIRGA